MCSVSGRALALAAEQSSPARKNIHSLRNGNAQQCSGSASASTGSDGPQWDPRVAWSFLRGQSLTLDSLLSFPFRVQAETGHHLHAERDWNDEYQKCVENIECADSRVRCGRCGCVSFRTAFANSLRASRTALRASRLRPGFRRPLLGQPLGLRYGCRNDDGHAKFANFMALHDLVEDFKEMVERCRMQHTTYNV